MLLVKHSEAILSASSRMYRLAWNVTLHLVATGAFFRRKLRLRVRNRS